MVPLHGIVIGLRKLKPQFNWIHYEIAFNVAVSDWVMLLCQREPTISCAISDEHRALLGVLIRWHLRVC